jgi:hypothetical protein
MHQIAGSVPDVWLQGMGFFALQVSLFLALAMYSQRMQGPARGVFRKATSSEKASFTDE